MGGDNPDDNIYDLEMIDVVDDSPSDEFDPTDVDSEYGEVEQTLKPKTVTAANKSYATNINDFYKISIRRQNICFGSSVFFMVGMFIAAYFYMGVSFSPANVGIFGDELSMKGAAGEVGLDADNAETQEIIDEEIIELEETGNWGDNAKEKKSNLDGIIFDKSKIGEHNWVEQSDWWKKNMGNMDVSNMTKKELKTYEKMKKKQQREKKKKDEMRAKVAKYGKAFKPTQEGTLGDIDAIKENLANRYHNIDGKGKDKYKQALDDIYHMNQKKNGIRPDDWSKGKNQNNGYKPPGGMEDQSHNDVNQMPKDTRNYFDGDSTEEGASAMGKNEQLEVSEEANEGELVTTISKSYRVVEQVGHDNKSFTQGISYCSDGKIYETTGLYGQSKVRRINPDTFLVEKTIDSPNEFFGEGSTCFIGPDGKERLVEITWKQHRGFLYDVPSLEVVHSFDFETTPPSHQGWGITYDSKNHELIVSDGTPYLYFWDPDNFKIKRRVEVTRFDGRRQDMINELEFMDGLVCYNIWHQDQIICADPETGKSVREYDFSDIWPSNQRGGSENVLNGIALGKDHVLITGKRWDRMYKVVFDDWPSLFNNNDN